MTFLPIVERELRAAARKPSTYRWRTLFTLVTSLVAALLVLIGDQTFGRQVGQAVFPTLASLAFFYCLLAAASIAADSISEEKREGTLGLLFLTDLKGYDVILGKFVGVSARAFQGLFAFLPVLSVGLVLGGITAGEFWRASLVLTNALFFALCVSLCVSTFCSESHVSLALVLVMLAISISLPPGITYLCAGAGKGSWIAFDLLSPAACGLRAADLTYRSQAFGFWLTLFGNHSLGWMFLVLASWGLPRYWQDGVATRKGSESALSRQQPNYQFRQQLLNVSPILWLTTRNERHRKLIWAIVAVLTFASLGTFGLSLSSDQASPALTTALGIAIRLILKLWIAWYACATLAEARRTGAVELILATPLRIKEILWGHWKGMQRIFFWPVTAAMVITFLPAIETLLHQDIGWSSLMILPIPAITLFGVATFVLDVLAIVWVGMWMGITQVRPLQAFAKTVLYVMIIPTVAFCLPNILFDLFWMSWARRNLEQGFRRAAAHRYATDSKMPAATLSAPPRFAPPIICT